MGVGASLKGGSRQRTRRYESEWWVIVQFCGGWGLPLTREAKKCFSIIPRIKFTM